jgi:hypothetical protein
VPEDTSHLLTADAINGPLTGRTKIIPDDRQERIERERAVQALARLRAEEQRSIMGPGPCVREFPYMRYDSPMLPVDEEYIADLLRQLQDQQERPHRSEIDLSDAEWIT